MKSTYATAKTLPLAVSAIALVSALATGSPPDPPALAPDGAVQQSSKESRTLSDEALLHEQKVMQSRYCASCHPAIYAEHERSTHGRAFTDPEVRLATGRFDHGDCIICHTPRPIFETGIGMNPRRREHNLEEGNTCMTCHWREGYDYSTFNGGPDCTDAFDDRVAEVEACGSCHRNHGTPFQWATSPLGKEAGRLCVDCHMPGVLRPVAVGEEPRRVASHGFPGSRSDEQVKRAYSYEAALDGNEVVVTIENKGAGHNFPTELKQRSVESLVIVKDALGNEVSRSRMVFRDPYKRPYGLHLPVNTQIPSGESVEHRVPIKVADGTVECELHFKLYYPIQDHHPDLARRLEVRKLLFSGVTPSDKEVVSAPDVRVVTPENIDALVASAPNLVDYARPPIGTVEVEIPAGDSPEDIERLVGLFQFPVPQAAREAQTRLAQIGPPALPALITALGSWDNKTFNKAKSVLRKLGSTHREETVDALIAALSSDQLFERIHSREVLIDLDERDSDALRAQLVAALDSPNALDRTTATRALGELGFTDAIPEFMDALRDRDPDVVRAAALALAQLGVTDALPALRTALGRFIWPETRRDIARAMAWLGDPDAVPILLAGLDEHDDLIREDYFEALFEVTGLHMGYDPLAPRAERLDTIAHLQSYWASKGGPSDLRPYEHRDLLLEARLWHEITLLGDGGDDARIVQELLDAGDAAVPVLVTALKYPAGFSVKRQMVCETLGRIGNADAVPALIATLRDPVMTVASWACWALEAIGDREALAAIQRYERRIHTKASEGSLAAEAGTADALLAQATRARFRLGDESAIQDLVKFLLSPDELARRTSIDALAGSFGFDLDYRADAPLEERRAAAAEWAAALQ